MKLTGNEAMSQILKNKRSKNDIKVVTNTSERGKKETIILNVLYIMYILQIIVIIII